MKRAKGWRIFKYLDLRSCPHKNSVVIQRLHQNPEADLRSRRKGGHSLMAEQATKVIDNLMK